MTESDRTAINLQALIAPQPVIAGRVMQAFSAGRLQLCRAVGLRVLSGDAGSMTQAEVERDLLAFYFIHAMPLPEVKAACALPIAEFQASVIEPLSFDFPARDLPAVMSFLEREFRGVEAAQVEIAPKPNSESGETPPPNS